MWKFTAWVSVLLWGVKASLISLLVIYCWVTNLSNTQRLNTEATLLSFLRILEKAQEEGLVSVLGYEEQSSWLLPLMAGHSVGMDLAGSCVWGFSSWCPYFSSISSLYSKVEEGVGEQLRIIKSSSSRLPGALKAQICNRHMATSATFFYWLRQRLSIPRSGTTHVILPGSMFHRGTIKIIKW